MADLQGYRSWHRRCDTPDCGSALPYSPLFIWDLAPLQICYKAIGVSVRCLSVAYAILNTSRRKGHQMFTKKDGYYWVATSETSKVGYPSLVSLVLDRHLVALYITSVVVISTIVTALSVA